MPNGVWNWSHTISYPCPMVQIRPNKKNKQRRKVSYFISSYTLGQSKLAASNGTIPPISIKLSWISKGFPMCSYGKNADFQPTWTRASITSMERPGAKANQDAGTCQTIIRSSLQTTDFHRFWPIAGHGDFHGHGGYPKNGWLKKWEITLDDLGGPHFFGNHMKPPYVVGLSMSIYQLLVEQWWICLYQRKMRRLGCGKNEAKSFQLKKQRWA